MSVQSFQGALRGKVIDPNGATIPNAVVVVTDEGTATKRSTVTNGEGIFTLSSLTPSTYRVTVTAPGFKRTESAGVQVATQASVTLDFKMELGQVSESINVTSESNEVEIATV